MDPRRQPPSASRPPVGPGPRWPRHLWLGLALIAFSWPATWHLPGLRSHYLFFPLWLGYVFTVDALVLRRSGSSLLTRAPRDLARLLAASVPTWWLFEVLNWRLGNWVYLGRDEVGDLEYVLFASLAFSTVLPAVFESAELLGTFGWVERLRGRRALDPSPGLLAGSFALGALMLVLLLAWPRIFFPLTWLALLFLLDPVVYRLSRPSLLARLERGDRRLLVALPLAALLCGFFWELWNLHAYPKWVYEIPVPWLDVAHLFEMPLPGYLGYLPFGLELYPLTHLLLRRPPALRP